MKRILIPAFAGLALAACGIFDKPEITPTMYPTVTKSPPADTQKVIYDIKKLIHRSPDGVARILGKPSKTVHNPTDCAGVGACDQEIHYKGDDITVLYSKGRAVWFDFENLYDIDWNHKLKAFGLTDTEPDESMGGDTELFNSFTGIKTISFKHGVTGVKYAVVEAP